jgi:hypothetical protein
MKLITTLSMLFAAVLAASNSSNITDWEANPYDEEQYFKDIPDLVNITDLTFKFRMAHWYLTGFERGIYNDSSIRLNPECFGKYYITKVNEYEYLFEADPFGNIFENVMPEVSLTFQFIYMFNTQCGVDETVNDFMVFCWYRGCWPRQIMLQSGSKILYVMRAINDAAIIWYEGIPDGKMSQEDLKSWDKLAESTGLTVAQILQDLTGFYRIKDDEKH